ncbi:MULTISPECIES: hypothetical protein [unclassified Peribacillus]|uniref:hypothetical protein n=1 Tax=unclassified Peribacillus TaxID=2675266 RepID=UPI001E30A907|nr:hypothetical protein [Peribacillus sp. Bi96]
MKKNNSIVFYVIKGSTIKKFLILDLVVGTGIYFAVKFISSSLLMASLASIIGTEGIKKAPKILKKIQF